MLAGRPSCAASPSRSSTCSAAAPAKPIAAAIENHRRYANVHGYAYYHTTTSDPEHRTRHNTFAVDAQFHKLRRVRELPDEFGTVGC